MRVGYQSAATLGPWAIETPEDSYADGRWTLSAALVTRDAFWCPGDGRYDLRLSVGKNFWRWRDCAAVIGDSQIIIRHQGKPEIV